MNLLSDEQIRNMISELPEQSQRSIAKSMTVIERELTGKPTERRVHIRTELKPGDIGALIQLHGWVYANECGYNPVFEGYVCKTFYDLLQTYSTDKDRFWIVESDEEIVGSIAVIGHPDKKPKFDGLSCIRITEEWVLERNLSKRQSRTAENEFQHVFLETTDDQKRQFQCI